MSRGYLGVLAAVAALVLGVGVFVRGRLLRDSAPTSAPPSEATALQQLSQEGQLRRTSEYFAERVAAAGASVVYLPALDASGVRWGRDSVLSTGDGEPVVAVRAPAADSLRPPPAVAPVLDSDPARSDSVRRAWLLVVGRRADGQLLSIVATAGGRTPVRCAGHDLAEYLLAAPVPPALAGAGVFDLGGRLVGMVVRCDGRVAAIPAGRLGPLLAEGPAPELRRRYGLTLEPLGEAARVYFRTDSGLLVTAVRRGGPADAAGLQAGDVIVGLDDRAVVDTGDVAGPDRALGAGAPAAGHTVVRRRGRTTAIVLLPPADVARREADSGHVGLVLTPAPAPRGVPVTAVRPGSPAAAGGLRPGDRLLRVGDAPVSSPGEGERLLAAAARSPAFVVFERDSVERGVLLRP